MFWNYSKKSSQSGTLFLRVWFKGTRHALSRCIYAFRDVCVCVRVWLDDLISVKSGYSVSMQTPCTVITSCEFFVCPWGESDYCKTCMTLPTEAQMAKAISRLVCRCSQDHCLSAHWDATWMLSLKHSETMWPCVALVLHDQLNFKVFLPALLGEDAPIAKFA